MDQFAFLQYLHDVFGISSCAFSADFHRVFQTDDLYERHDLLAQGVRDLLDPQALPEEVTAFPLCGNIQFLAVCRDDRLFLCGPLGLSATRKEDEHRFYRKYRIRESTRAVYFTDALRLQKLAGMWGLGLTGAVSDTTPAAVFWQALQRNYYFAQEAVEASRLSYAKELLWLHAIESGELHKDPALVTDAIEADTGDPYQSIGKMSANSIVKQVEYTAVVTVALATRAAIRGGVPPVAAYHHSDQLLQTLSTCEHYTEMLRVLGAVAESFSRLVEQYRQDQNASTPIRKAKDYIEAHLYRPFSVAEMAQALYISRSYLSAKFSEETGMSIKQYTTARRLSVAADMLRYTDTPVSQIAERLQFSSAGRFAESFREKYGMTPLRYRKISPPDGELATGTAQADSEDAS